jgi:hypothetical protein
MARVRPLLFGTAFLLALAPTSLALAQDVACYVDRVGGDDSWSGLSEGEAVKTQAKIGSTCTMTRSRRGSVFNEVLKISSKVKTYTNYGDAGAPLPQFVVPHTAGSSYNGMVDSGWMMLLQVNNTDQSNIRWESNCRPRPRRPCRSAPAAAAPETAPAADVAVVSFRRRAARA